MLAPAVADAQRHLCRVTRAAHGGGSPWVMMADCDHQLHRGDDGQHENWHLHAG